MSAYYKFLNKLINHNHESFKDFNQINWLNPYKAEEYDEIRQTIVQDFSTRINWSFKKTKPWINQISKGCELCGKGEWSCIFITGRCNAKCFYCPAPQTSDDKPMAQQLNFETAQEYADFVNHFGFKGISFSGGEPFLVFDRTLEFLSTIRKQCNPDIYIWLYTNGILSTREKFRILAETGLNEVRFDIGASNYQLDFIKNASGIIKNITVEIPLDPEKKDFIINLLPELVDSGVTNLNLHQLRMTRHNSHQLLKRNYTYLHGEHPTVLESELAILEILSYADKTGIPLGINYCGFQYKNRFQKAAYRKKIAGIMAVDKNITENGYIMNIYAPALSYSLPDHPSSTDIKKLISDKLIENITPAQLTEKSDIYNEIVIDFSGIMLSNDNENNIGKRITIGNKNYKTETGRPVAPILIRKEKIKDLIAIFKSGNGAIVPEDDDLFEVWRHFYIEEGFRQYF